MIKEFRFKPAEIGTFSGKNAGPVADKIQKNCRIIGLTEGAFSLVDLIHSILEKTGRARVVVATWSAGIKDVSQIKWMMDTDMISDFKILTDHSYKSRQKKYAASIENLFGIENIRTSEMHAKFALIENDKYKIAIRSSMNLNANRTCELFEIDEGAEIYDFLMSFILHTFRDMEPGFVESSEKVSKCVKMYFLENEGENIHHHKNWWEAGTTEE